MGNNGKLRIVSDGTGWGTKIYGPDGQELDLGSTDIEGVEWLVSAGEIARATLNLVHVEISAIAPSVTPNDHTFAEDGCVVGLERRKIIDRDTGVEYDILVVPEDHERTGN